ncbi:hypothetical protein FQN60_003464 [Etheostoma spectabile]|uniref:C1q domain-containing protein n=1 Tax=Etheostoma spectabile TaxID=54343 RepID=A0A5J5CW11_9PERO|nr:hypothetical protein FQN60_003464 [Etheostoma spectabile]
MSSTKVLVFVCVMGLCVTSLVGANPFDLGSLRDIQIDPIIFNQVVVNQGSAYDNDTGVFTAPVSGIYQFVFAAQLCRGDHNNVWYFMINGNRRMACHAQVSGGDTTLNTCYCLEELKKADQVWVRQMVGSCAWASTTSKTITFSGVLLSSEGVSTLGGKYDSGSSCPLPSLGRVMVSSSVDPRASLSCVAVTLLLCCLLLD